MVRYPMIQRIEVAPHREPHQCHFCGTYVLDGYEIVTEKIELRDYSGDRGIPSGKNSSELGKKWNQYKRRHWLSDCRPDLVQHEVGPACTWWNMQYRDGEMTYNCYAYQNDDAPGRPWTDEHKYFYEDGPM